MSVHGPAPKMAPSSPFCRRRALGVFLFANWKSGQAVVGGVVLVSGGGAPFLFVPSTEQHGTLYELSWSVRGSPRGTVARGAGERAIAKLGRLEGRVRIGPLDSFSPHQSTQGLSRPLSFSLRLLSMLNRLLTPSTIYVTPFPPRSTSSLRKTRALRVRPSPSLLSVPSLSLLSLVDSSFKMEASLLFATYVLRLKLARISRAQCWKSGFHSSGLFLAYIFFFFWFFFFLFFYLEWNGARIPIREKILVVYFEACIALLTVCNWMKNVWHGCCSGQTKRQCRRRAVERAAERS